MTASASPRLVPSDYPRCSRGGTANSNVFARAGIGGEMPMREVGRKIAKRISGPVFATEDRHAAEVLDGTGSQAAAAASTPLAVENYTAEASVEFYGL